MTKGEKLDEKYIANKKPVQEKPSINCSSLHVSDDEDFLLKISETL